MLVDGGYIDNLPVSLQALAKSSGRDSPCSSLSQVSTMTAMGASRIFAIDVGGQYFPPLPLLSHSSSNLLLLYQLFCSGADDTSPRNYGDSVSGFWVLLNRYNPFSDASTIPTLTEVTSRLT